MSAVFTADLHLKLSGDPEHYRSFRDFLEHISGKFSRLYILGDLFAYWYEHPGVDLCSANPGLRALKDFSESGHEVYFIYGNRDFTAGESFRRYSGVSFIGPELDITSGGKKIHLCHGDSLAKRDIRYRIWKALIRSRISLFVFSRLPVGAAVSLADTFKQVGKNRKYAAEAVNVMAAAEARKIIISRNIDALISGHTHLRHEESFQHRGRKRQVFILPEFSFPGDFLTLDKGKLSYERLG